MLKHIHLEQCDSTQAELERHLSSTAGPQEHLLISTSRQDMGRGRGAHTWAHLPGSVAFSFSTSPHPQLTWQALEVATIMAEFLEMKSAPPLQLKWPNDLYSRDKKCGGILIKAQGERVLIGVGLNLLANTEWGSVWADGHSLPKYFERDWPKEFVDFYEAEHPRSTAKLRLSWEKRCLHLGKVVTITDGESKFHGDFIGLGKHGEALLKTQQGEIQVFNGSLRWD